VRQGSGCCCDSDNVKGDNGTVKYWLDKPEPKMPPPKTLKVCEYSKKGEITGGFAKVCPEESDCPLNTEVLLEEFKKDPERIGRCCCASAEDKTSIFFL
jgi:hypothetical protein